jgi:sulfide:quinone oxidoreductase
MRARAQVLVAGGGVAALEAVLALQALAQDRVVVTVLSPSTRFAYRPFAVAEPFGLGRVHRFELASLLRGRDVLLVRGSLVEVDADGRRAITDNGDAIPYDALLVAVGARARPAIPGAFTFGGDQAVPSFRALLKHAVNGQLDTLVFALPDRVAWALPLYELALMTAVHFGEKGASTSVELVTPERSPLEIFGPEGAATVGELLQLRGIALRTATRPTRAERGRLHISPGGFMAADAVVALPRPEGPRIAGLPADADGFIPVNDHGAVVGVDDVYAAGDATTFPLKQGGLAAEQADAAAATVAASLGAAVEPRPFRPVLRGLLLAGRAPRYLRAETLSGKRIGEAADEATQWPPAKIAGRYLTAFLALHGVPAGPPPGSVAVGIEMEFPPGERLP